MKRDCLPLQQTSADIWRQQKRELEERVECDDAGIEFDGYYSIAADRCTNHAELVGWVWHLVKKPWVTAPMLMAFIDFMASANGISLHEQH